MHRPELTIIALVLVFVLCQWAAAWSKAQVVRALGWWGVPLTTGWIGVPIHELSHVLAAWLMLRRVERVRFFAPDGQTGTLGEVQWQPGTGPLAWLALCWVGIAPLLGGALCLRGLLQLAARLTQLPMPAMPASASVADWQDAALALTQWAVACTRSVWARPDAAAWLAVLGWWAVVSIAAHMTPSRADLAPAWKGAIVIAVLAAAGLFALQGCGIPWHGPVVHALQGGAWLVAPGLMLALAATLVVGAAAAVLARLRGAR